MHKKYHEKFKILDILAVTTQAHKGIETSNEYMRATGEVTVTTQAHKGIETSIDYRFQRLTLCNNSSP